MGAGWIGSSEDLYGALAASNCDRTKDGKFAVSGNITSFLGMGDEFCIGEDAKYYYNGKPYDLAPLLRDSTKGMAIEVI